MASESFMKSDNKLYENPFSSTEDCTCTEKHFNMYNIRCKQRMTGCGFVKLDMLQNYLLQFPDHYNLLTRAEGEQPIKPSG